MIQYNGRTLSVLGIVIAVVISGAWQVAGCAHPPETQANEEMSPWKKSALSDVEEAYHLYRVNHPGVYNPTDPSFTSRLERAREAALDQAAEVRTRQGYQTTLATFTAHLNDGHAQVKPVKRESPDMWWPGFVVAWRHNELVVHHSAIEQVEAGFRILTCDGKEASELVERTLTRHYGRPSEEGQWWSTGPKTFVDFTPSTRDRVQQCQVADQNQRTKLISLSWSQAPENLDKRLAAASDGERTPIGLTEPRPGVYLIGMSTFKPDDSQSSAYRELFAQLEARHDELSAARAVIFDLRHNRGGSSDWSEKIAEQLWGKAAVEKRKALLLGDVSIWWRATSGNTETMEGYVPMLRRQGRDELAREIAEIAEGMQAARSGGEHYFIEKSTEQRRSDLKAGAEPVFSTPVYVITPGRCASACLDAVDLFREFPGVKLIGAPTSADSNYMEVRAVNLPSGSAYALIPMKVWMGRKRPAGAVYSPDILIDDLHWSTSTFLDYVEADLTERAKGR